MDYVNELKELFGMVGINVLDCEADEEIQIDSIQFVTLVVFIEERFEVEIPEEYMEGDLNTLGKFNDLIKELKSN